jgi:uncharacterized protein (DUF983 family)
MPRPYPDAVLSVAAEASAPVTRGFCAPCPKCSENTVQVCLADVSQLYCTSCEEEIALAEVRALVAAWAKVLSWLDAAPALEG